MNVSLKITKQNWSPPLITDQLDLRLRQIIVIDDLQTNVALLSAHLRKLENVEIIGFTDARAALQACRISPPDLVLVDYQMPDMDGVEFIEKFADIPTCANKPVIVVTGEQGVDLLSRALDAGACDFVRKPVEHTELLARARSMLRLSEANRQLHLLATEDVLTGLNNRRFFMARVPDELERCRRSGDSLAVALFDIDHFKTINDRFGHPAGDAVLRQVAARFRTVCRSIDVWGRVGGEEFGLLLPGITPARALIACERVRLAIAEAPFCTKTEAALPVTISCGVAITAGFESDDALISRADAALYTAKRTGRDRVAIAP